MCILLSLGYKGKDIPGEVHTLDINPRDPKQVCVCVCVCVRVRVRVRVRVCVAYIPSNSDTVGAVGP